MAINSVYIKLADVVMGFVPPGGIEPGALRLKGTSWGIGGVRWDRMVSELIRTGNLKEVVTQQGKIVLHQGRKDYTYLRGESLRGPTGKELEEQDITAILAWAISAPPRPYEYLEIAEAVFITIPTLRRRLSRMRERKLVTVTLEGSSLRVVPTGKKHYRSHKAKMFEKPVLPWGEEKAKSPGKAPAKIPPSPSKASEALSQIFAPIAKSLMDLKIQKYPDTKLIQVKDSGKLRGMLHNLYRNAEVEVSPEELFRAGLAFLYCEEQWIVSRCHPWEFFYSNIPRFLAEGRNLPGARAKIPPISSKAVSPPPKAETLQESQVRAQYTPPERVGGTTLPGLPKGYRYFATGHGIQVERWLPPVVKGFWFLKRETSPGRWTPVSVPLEVRSLKSWMETWTPPSP